ncbi:MAG TPA: hypothetical protein VMS96_06520 [Terriglobales bacterium]|nr:hypothetical protein [Terriglobales bacterium]
MKTKIRKEMAPVARRVRAYFAPVDRAIGAPTVFDPARAFDLDAPCAPWIDLGAIDNFCRTPATKVQAVCRGAKAAAAAQFRSRLEARVEFDFREWGKLQMALAAGSQHMNVLEEAEDASACASGGTAVSAVPLAADSTAGELVFAAAPPFAAGDLLAVDIDYADQTGYVGTGIAAAFVRDPTDVQHEADYIRRVTFNVGRVATVSGTTVTLEQALLGGVPPAGAAAQKVVAFVDREGGSFFQEWSALFVLPEEAGGRVCFHYPRLQAAAPAQETAIEIADPLRSYALHAAWLALPVTDPNDGEQVVCYRSHAPVRKCGIF